MKNKALFLDLDHTIIRPKSGKVFPSDKNDWEFIEGVLSVIKEFQNDYYIIIVSNQGGIESKYITELDVMDKLLNIRKSAKDNGVKLDKAFYSKTNNKNDIMRKPNNGMALRAMDHYDINLDSSIMVGDMDSDKEFAKNSGIGTYYDIKDFLKIKKDS